MSTTASHAEDAASRSYARALHAAHAALADLQQAIVDFAPFCERLRCGVAHGEDVIDLVVEAKHDGVDVRRRRLHEAMRQVDRDLQRVRGLSVLVLMEQGGLSITDAARLSGISPQMARRLARAARREKDLDGTAGSSLTMGDTGEEEGASPTWLSAVPNQKTA